MLHGVSLRAAAGTMTALVGISGSGKTTIAGLAASFLVPDAGTVTVDGHDLRTVTLDSYRSQLGVVLQSRRRVGGHCIAVDSWFHRPLDPERTPLIRAARQNEPASSRRRPPRLVTGRTVAHRPSGVSRCRPSVTC